MPSPSSLPDVHLDLGCGKRPRNPYGRSRLCGIDIRALADTLTDPDFEFRGANLAVEPIPFESDSFGSVSAFDFIEHVPRVLATPDGRDTFFPFVRLMDEIWRVLAPGGLLYALTPAWPNPEVFVDPTHVNVITERTHEYFCGDSPMGRMYGFRGSFRLRRAHWAKQHEAYSARPFVPPPQSMGKRFAHGVRDGLRRLRGRMPPPHSVVYFLWELEAAK
jgi:SAM-dependent methyltransferase